MEHFKNLMEQTGFNDTRTMFVHDHVLDNVRERPTAMRSTLRALAVGDTDEFMSRARDLGLDKDQAALAVRDTAALAALIMQIGVVDAW